MRRGAAILAILLAVLPLLGLAVGFDITASSITMIIAMALIAAAVAALRGGDLIYLASAWGLYLGMNLAAYIEVLGRFLEQSAPEARFGVAAITVLLVLSLSGLLLCLRAHQIEKRA